MSISNSSIPIRMHAHPPGCALDLVVTSWKMSILSPVPMHAQPLFCPCNIHHTNILMHGQGAGMYLVTTMQQDQFRCIFSYIINSVILNHATVCTVYSNNKPHPPNPDPNPNPDLQFQRAYPQYTSCPRPRMEIGSVS